MASHGWLRGSGVMLPNAATLGDGLTRREHPLSSSKVDLARTRGFVTGIGLVMSTRILLRLIGRIGSGSYRPCPAGGTMRRIIANCKTRIIIHELSGLFSVRAGGINERFLRARDQIGAQRNAGHFHRCLPNRHPSAENVGAVVIRSWRKAYGLANDRGIELPG